MSASTDPAADTVVMKFGGSSVADPDRIRHVARRLVDARERGLRVVGTVSAMGRTTDTLLELAGSVSPDPDPRELDMLLSTGERIAGALVAMAIHDLGQGKIVLVAGFQGFSRDTMDVTTLGRGGTDATAVALAAALGASCEIYSDVSGVFTADPRIVPEARKLPVVSYDEMLEMAASGARVLMLRAVELARGHAVRIHARSTFSDEPGTWVQEHGDGSDQAVRAVTHSDDDVLFTVRGLAEGTGAVASILRTVADERVSVDLIVVSAGQGGTELAFSVARADVPQTRRALEAAEARLGPLQTQATTDLGKLSVVGEGVRTQPGVAARMFRALEEGKIDVRLISTSPLKVSCLVDRSDVERGVHAFHDAFELAAEATP